MTALEDLIQAAMSAPPERREAALRLLQGNVPKPEPYLSLSELARRLGLCRATLRRWCVPGHDLGGRRRYRLTEVEAYFKTEDFQRRQAALRAERRNASARPRIQFGVGQPRPTRRQNHIPAELKP
jgi:transposase-like protein